MQKPKKKFHVYGMGNALVDYEYLIEDDFLKEFNFLKSSMTLIDQNQRAKLFDNLSHFKKRQGGGSAANTLIALSQLGSKCCYSCRVATDEDGQFYLDDLNNQGVDHHQNAIVSDVHEVTGSCVVLVTPDAERTMCTYLGITAHYGKNDVDFSYLEQADYLYIEGYLFCSDEGTKAVLEATKYARKNNIKIALTCSDAGVVQAFRNRFEECLNGGIDLLFCNEAEALTLSGQKDVYEAFNILKKYAHCVVVTRSEKGAVVFFENSLIEVPAKKVKSIDANGAGDMFAGAFMFGLINFGSIKKTVEFSCHCASEIIQVYGPRLEAEKLQEIKKLYI